MTRTRKIFSSLLAILLAACFTVSTFVVSIAKTDAAEQIIYVVQLLIGDADPATVTGTYAVIPEQEGNPLPKDDEGRIVQLFSLNGNVYEKAWFTFTEPGTYQYTAGKLKEEAVSKGISKDDFEPGTKDYPLTHEFGFKVERSEDGSLTVIPYTCEDNQAVFFKDGRGMTLWNYILANRPEEPSTEPTQKPTHKTRTHTQKPSETPDNSGNNNQNNNQNNNNNSNNNQGGDNNNSNNNSNSNQGGNNSQNQSQNSSNDNSNGGNNNNISVIVNGGDSSNNGSQNQTPSEAPGADKNSSTTTSTTQPTSVQPVTNKNNEPVTNSNGSVRTTVVYANGRATTTTTRTGTAKARSANGVNTGDESHLVLWVVILAVAALGLVILFLARRNRDDDEETL